MGLFAVLSGPLEFDLTRRALLEITIVGAACGVVGVLVVLRGLSFISDALAHCVVPGVVLAYLLQGSLGLWGGGTTLLAAWGMAVLARRGALGGDTSIAIVFSGAFALGLALISGTGSYINDLTEILFGNILGVSTSDLWISAGAAALVLVAVFAFYRPLVFASFDPVGLQAVGLPLDRLDLLLYSLIALAVTSGLVAVGSLLVTALIIVPAATARLIARSVAGQMLVSSALACLAGWSGVYLSYFWNVASGGAIVLTSVALFMLVAAAPRSGFFRSDRVSPKPDASWVKS